MSGFDILNRKSRERLDRESRPGSPKPPAIARQYDPIQGVWSVQEGRDFYNGCKAITNGIIRPGSEVVRKGNLIDARRKPKELQFRALPRGKKDNIKYLLAKTVSGVTSLWVCGWQEECVKVVDLPAGASINDAVLDNLGGNDYYVTLFYAGGQGVFQYYDQTGLLKQYSEAGLTQYQERPFYSGIDNQLDIDAGWWNGNYIFPVGYGRFICNYGQDSGTSEGRFPLSGGVNPGEAYTGAELGKVYTATKSSAIRFVIDLQSSEPIKKFIHPPNTLTLIFTRGLLGDLEEYWTDKWLGLTVAASLLNSAPSQIDEYLRVATGFNIYKGIDSTTRHVYRINENGDVALGEILKVSESSGPGWKYSSQDGGYFIYVNDPLNGDSLHRVTGPSQSITGDTINNRFLRELSQFQNGPHRGRHFMSIGATGLNFVEYLRANPNAQPVPIADTTLFRIERATKPRQVTVWFFDFEFQLQEFAEIEVFPPNINKGETSNFGTVLAAAYG